MSKVFSSFIYLLLMLPMKTNATSYGLDFVPIAWNKMQYEVVLPPPFGNVRLQVEQVKPGEPYLISVSFFESSQIVHTTLSVGTVDFLGKPEISYDISDFEAPKKPTEFQIHFGYGKPSTVSSLNSVDCKSNCDAIWRKVFILTINQKGELKTETWFPRENKEQNLRTDAK